MKEKFSHKNNLKIIPIVVGPLKTNCYLLVSGKEGMVVDPGDDAEKIIQEIEKESVSIKYIFITHGHFDHNLAKDKLQRETKGQILTNLKDGQIVSLGENDFSILHTPGHTQDSFSLKGEGFLISGDVLFLRGHGRTDLPGGNQEKIEETLEKLRKNIAKEAVIYPGHGNCFTMQEWENSFS